MSTNLLSDWLLPLVIVSSLATGAAAEEKSYPRHCMQSDHLQKGMKCEEDLSSYRCESNDRTVCIVENTYQQSTNRAPRSCNITTKYKLNSPCVVDPAPNEPTCNHEARMIVAKRHGFSDMAHAGMSETIYGSERLKREFDKSYKTCMTKNNFCIYRD